MKTDALNIFLMLISFGLAVIIPFELFLLSYAILGPLHYLTEISWLHKKQYFIEHKNNYLALVIFCVLIAGLTLIINLNPAIQNSQSAQSWFLAMGIEPLQIRKLFSLTATLIFLAFAGAIIFTFVKDWWFKINLLALALIAAFIFKDLAIYQIFFGILLTTIIHIWLFTALFILSGALKTRFASGYISLAVFLICSLGFIFISSNNHIINSKTLEIIQIYGLQLNDALFGIFNLDRNFEDFIYSQNGLKIQSFIAFAYTYHYLNWFSKVNIIKWNQISKRSAIILICVWAAAVGLYAYNYQSGLIFLFFLSILHVFLEFPLNLQTIKSLINSLMRKLYSKILPKIPEKYL